MPVREKSNEGKHWIVYLEKRDLIVAKILNRVPDESKVDIEKWLLR